MATDQSGDIPPAVDDVLAFLPDVDGIEAVDALTGQHRWRVAGLGDVEHQPVVAAGTLYAVTTDRATRRSTLFAIAAAIGQRGASVPLPTEAGPPAVVADMVVVPLADGLLVALADA